MDLHSRISPARIGHSCIDLFSGAGGFAVGFRSAGWSVLAANDADKFAGETFRLNFPEASFFQGGIEELTAAEILKESDIERGELDCMIGGPPCQSFSYNNHKRSASDERARLFEYYLGLVDELNPKTLVMENVPGILTIDEGKVVEEILLRLGELGFDATYDVLSAEQFGVPQSRRRVFMVASRVGPAAELIPEPTHWSRRFLRGKAVSEDRPARATKRVVTVWQAIGDLPPIENGGGATETGRAGIRATTTFQREIRDGFRALHNHTCHKLTHVNLDRIQHVPEGGNWRDVPFDLLPAGMQRAKPTDHTKRYGRLARNGLASTILTKCDPHWGAYVHPTQDRTISVREAARLQGFPDSFRFAGTNVGAQYVQVGNAVPVLVAKAIAQSVRDHVDQHKSALEEAGDYDMPKVSEAA